VLDVVATEPLPADHWMWRHPGVTLTPHISAQTLCADAVVQVAHAVEALERGEPLPGQVDRPRGY
jgi:glyoxylate/hydroxypyruvate reductase A